VVVDPKRYFGPRDSTQCGSRSNADPSGRECTRRRRKNTCRCTNSSGHITHLDEARHAIVAAAGYPVQPPEVKVDVEVGGLPEALDQRDGAAVALVGLQPSAVRQMARDHPRCATCSIGVTGCNCDASSNRSAIGGDKTHWRSGTCGMTWSDQMGGGLRHPAGPARRTEP
jgi:hypothetical protein